MQKYIDNLDDFKDDSRPPIVEDVYKRQTRRWGLALWIISSRAARMKNLSLIHIYGIGSLHFTGTGERRIQRRPQ